MAHRFYGHKVVGEFPLTTIRGRFNGTIFTRPDRLDIPCGKRPYRLRKPKVYAVWNDLFHEDVPEDFIRKAYRVMVAEGNGHTYLVLTKRPRRMAGFLSDETVPDNIYHGLTVCNQAEADEKIPIFLEVPGNKFLSIEPMLGVIFLSRDWIDRARYFESGVIDAVILGGETGSGARPMHPGLVRSIRDQCQAAGVPFFFKGFGSGRGDFRAMYGRDMWNQENRRLDGRTHDELPWRRA
jgi:protein gp37